MNNFGAMLRQVGFLSCEEDRQRVLAAYLDSLTVDDREAACTFLVAPAMTRRTQLRSLRRYLEERMTPGLFELSHAFAGDLGETMALLWPREPGANRPVGPAELLEGLKQTGPLEIQARLAAWLSGCDTPGRHAIIRIVTGTLRNPVPITTLTPILAAHGVQVPTSVPRDADALQTDLFGPSHTASIPPGEIDAVLLYVEQGRTHPPILLCTFAAWSGSELVPIARVDAGSFSEQVRDFVARHTTRRFGPTREVSHDADTALVASIAYETVEPATRRRAGLTLKAPALLSVRPNASANDAGDLDALTSLLPPAPSHGY